MSKFGVFLIFLSFLVILYAAFYIINPLKMIGQRNDAERVKNLENIAEGLRLYHRDYGSYPESSEDTFEITSTDKEVIHWGGSFAPYLMVVPKDKSKNRNYVYWSDNENGNKTYKLYASLEYPEFISESCGEKDCPNVPGKNLCGESLPCNYGITSGNVSP
jgi:hypothetical protein